MIRLTSAPTAEAHARLDHCKQLRERLSADEEVPDSINNCYRHQDVKASLVEETSEKCAYCESKITHVYWGDVEHIFPKNQFPELSLEYDNLTLACAICNNKKLDYYNQEAPILHPYNDIPEDQLVGAGPFLWHRDGSPAGQRTIDLLDLNREKLREQRLECIERLSALADRYESEPDGLIKNTLGAQIREETKDSAEFALVARSFLLATHNLKWNEV